jgi:hypothetical protein
MPNVLKPRHQSAACHHKNSGEPGNKDDTMKTESEIIEHEAKSSGGHIVSLSAGRPTIKESFTVAAGQPAEPRTLQTVAYCTEHSDGNRFFDDKSEAMTHCADDSEPDELVLKRDAIAAIALATGQAGMTRIDKLKAAALTATPGKRAAKCRSVNYVGGEWSRDEFLQWEVTGIDEPSGRGDYYQADAVLIAALDPETVLKLIAVVEAAKAYTEEYRGYQASGLVKALEVLDHD